MVFSEATDGAEQPAGFVILYRPLIEPSPFRGTVEKLLVSPKFHRRGLARKLMEKLEEEAKARTQTLLEDTGYDDWGLRRDGVSETGLYPDASVIRIHVPHLTTFQLGVIPNYADLAGVVPLVTGGKQVQPQFNLSKNSGNDHDSELRPSGIFLMETPGQYQTVLCLSLSPSDFNKIVSRDRERRGNILEVLRQERNHRPRAQKFDHSWVVKTKSEQGWKTWGRKAVTAFVIMFLGPFVDLKNTNSDGVAHRDVQTMKIAGDRYLLGWGTQTYIHGAFEAQKNGRNGGGKSELSKDTVFPNDGGQELLVNPDEQAVVHT
ncbi:hypothetical protein DFH08DRAFT_935015 [Mycena albidolilacea]|uniref:N-acetyltransferase domain-containing protein n=1 Tax=Mycena albidolilacea TaxID=1033008 RepID=A0AAD7A881_9AGAR|nr:hypothetical protein DFH08DRAFT_935015 [Mycena albidolilacea]